MRVMVTGGAGYVGSACLRYLLKHGHEAVAVDDLSQGHAGSVPGDRLKVGDIADTGMLTDLLRTFKADAVMHFAAATYVGESVSNPEFHYRNNIGGTLSLLNAMREAGVSRLIFSSTSATYGVAAKMPISEESPQAPINPYGRTKLAVEWMIRDFAHAYGMGFTMLRYFNAAGADEDGRYGEDHRTENHLIPLVLQVPLGKRPQIDVFGDDYPTPDGSCIRDYVHTEDLAQAHLTALEATGPSTREVYNIGTGSGHTVFEVIKACEEVVGRPIKFRVVDRRPGDPPALISDATKLTTGLKWKPKFADIREICESAWKWHSAHPEGYGD